MDYYVSIPALHNSRLGQFVRYFQTPPTKSHAAIYYYSRRRGCPEWSWAEPPIQGF